MPFEKGNPGGGRNKGEENRATKIIKALVTAHIQDNYQGFLEDLQELAPKDRAFLFIKLLKLVLPRVKEEKDDENEGNNTLYIEIADNTK